VQNNEYFSLQSGTTSAFNNTGTFRKSAGTGTTGTSGIPFNNGGPARSL
jgi:hypothetical protein